MLRRSALDEGGDGKEEGERRKEGRGRTVRPGAGTAVGVVAELVDVHATLGGGVVALDVIGDGGLRGLGGLLKGHGTADGGITSEDSNWAIESGTDIDWTSL